MKKRNSGDETSKMMEAYYSCIGEAHVENIINDLNSKKEEIKKIEVPTSLDEWFYNYVETKRKDEDKKKLLTRIKRFSKRAAIILLVLFTAMSAVVFSVEAVRIRVFNFFMEKNENYTEVRIDVENSDSLTPKLDWESYYSPEYMPEGYFFETSAGGGAIKVLKYTDGENQIIITQARNGTDLQLDTEDAEVKEVAIDGNKGQLIIKGNEIMLFWYNDEVSFNINGQVSVEEIIKISESMKKNKK